MTKFEYDIIQQELTKKMNEYRICKGTKSDGLLVAKSKIKELYERFGEGK